MTRENVKAARSAFGAIRARGSRWQARYTGPNGERYAKSFGSRPEAEGWLKAAERDIHLDIWEAPGVTKAKASAARLTFAAYAADWLAHRQVGGRPIKPRTRAEYQTILDDHLVPVFGTRSVTAITADEIREWYRKLLPKSPTRRANVYGLMRTIMATAEGDGVIEANPVHVRGAGTVKRASKTEPATLAELETIVTEVDRISRTGDDGQEVSEDLGRGYGVMVLLAAWCALRYGELTELRRKDLVIDVDAEVGVIKIRRGVVRVDGEFKQGPPKSDAGVRDVTIPPHLVPVVADHLRERVGRGAEALLWPAEHGGHLAPSTFYRHYYRAREAAGRPDLRFHDLRHLGAVLAAQTGATLAELMERLGHSTPAAAMRYQHAAAGRGAEIARRLSALAAGA